MGTRLWWKQQCKMTAKSHLKLHMNKNEAFGKVKWTKDLGCVERGAVFQTNRWVVKVWSRLTLSPRSCLQLRRSTLWVPAGFHDYSNLPRCVPNPAFSSTTLVKISIKTNKPKQTSQHWRRGSHLIKSFSAASSLIDTFDSLREIWYWHRGKIFTSVLFSIGLELRPDEDRVRVPGKPAGANLSPWPPGKVVSGFFLGLMLCVLCVPWMKKNSVL